VMQKMRDSFVQGAKKNGTSEKKAGYLFELMEHFAGYGFNKSHSTAYAFLAYQTAYLKANYPRHFAASLLTIEAANPDKVALYLGECRDRGVHVLRPDINESQLRFTVEADKGVRFGLTAVKNVGEGAIASLLEVRKKQGRIRSMVSLCEELDLRLVNKRVFESLIKAGAFDSLAKGTAHEALPSTALRPRLKAAARDSSWGPGGPKPIEPDTSIGGIVAAVRPLKTKKGDRMAVFTLEDAQGSVEIIAFPEAYQRAAGMIEPGTMVLVRGKLERDDETARILASEIAPIQ